MKLGLIDKAEQIVLHLYSEPLQKFRNAARGIGPIQAPAEHRARIEAHFDPLPIWYPTFEGTQVDTGRIPAACGHAAPDADVPFVGLAERVAAPDHQP